MAVETVVGEDPAQVWMSGEQDSIEIVSFALEPVSAGIDRRRRRYCFFFPDGNLDPDAVILARRKQVVDDIEAPLPARPVDTADIGQIDELTPRCWLTQISQSCSAVSSQKGNSLSRS